eukprot:TRINITY_DN680_c0_g1_i3.p1 TRINITY_DN680_c0_g1~~TRINITY_DN680_c0_g1_i3.p1  ORF type:complete len:715 (+),score=273.30 TRINITY_DN680_c0_g1_i3:116-2260(+)
MGACGSKHGKIDKRPPGAKGGHDAGAAAAPGPHFDPDAIVSGMPGLLQTYCSEDGSLHYASLDGTGMPPPDCGGSGDFQLTVSVSTTKKPGMQRYEIRKSRDAKVKGNWVAPSSQVSGGKLTGQALSGDKQAEFWAVRADLSGPADERDPRTVYVKLREGACCTSLSDEAAGGGKVLFAFLGEGEEMPESDGDDSELLQELEQPDEVDPDADPRTLTPPQRVWQLEAKLARLREELELSDMPELGMVPDKAKVQQAKVLENALPLMRSEAVKFDGEKRSKERKAEIAALAEQKRELVATAKQKRTAGDKAGAAAAFRKVKEVEQEATALVEKEKKAVQKLKVKMLFVRFDRNNDGAWDFAEARAAAASSGVEMEEEQYKMACSAAQADPGTGLPLSVVRSNFQGDIDRDLRLSTIYFEILKIAGTIAAKKKRGEDFTAERARVQALKQEQQEAWEEAQLEAAAEEDEGDDEDPVKLREKAAMFKELGDEQSAAECLQKARELDGGEGEEEGKEEAAEEEKGDPVLREKIRKYFDRYDEDGDEFWNLEEANKAGADTGAPEIPADQWEAVCDHADSCVDLGIPFDFVRDSLRTEAEVDLSLQLGDMQAELRSLRSDEEKQEQAAALERKVARKQAKLHKLQQMPAPETQADKEARWERQEAELRERMARQATESAKFVSMEEQFAALMAQASALKKAGKLDEAKQLVLQAKALQA